MSLEQLLVKPYIVSIKYMSLSKLGGDHTKLSKRLYLN
jgi:hypothetical protein